MKGERASAWHAELWDSRDTSRPIITLAKHSFVSLCRQDGHDVCCIVVVVVVSLWDTSGDLRALQVFCFVYNDWTEKKSWMAVSQLSTFPFLQFKLFFFFAFFHLALFLFSSALPTVVVTAHYSANLSFFFLFFFPLFSFPFLFSTWFSRLFSSTTGRNKRTSEQVDWDDLVAIY